MVASSASIPAVLQQVDWQRLAPLLQALGRAGHTNINLRVGGGEASKLRAPEGKSPSHQDPVAMAREMLLPRLTAGQDRSHVTGLGDTLALRLAKMFSTAPAEIREGLGIETGYRTPERQAELYAAALRKYGSEREARRWVAPPGRSRHNHGEAADLAYAGRSLSHAPLAVVNWLHQNAARFGLAFPLSNEVWHVEPVESRRGR